MRGSRVVSCRVESASEGGDKEGKTERQPKRNGPLGGHEDALRLDRRGAMLDLLDRLLLEDAVLGHRVGEGGSGLPLGRGAGGALLHHLIDLLEREALGLRDEEVRVHKGRGAQATPDEEDGRLQVAAVLADHVGSDDGDDLFFQSVSIDIFF